MYLIGLTGGIAAGKSVVARRLSELGAVHIDADLLAREVVEPGTDALATIAMEFGPEVLDGSGRLDRAALGAVVFSDREKLTALEQITHPAVKELAAKRMSEVETRDPSAVIVYDVPLLVEATALQSYDLVVVVSASREERIRRLVELRGMTRADAERRISSQATDEQRLAIADIVIDSNGTLEQTIEQVDRLWERVSRPAGR